MKQCAVIIGVDNPGNMPALNCAAENAFTFSRWAREQHFDVITLADDKSPVTLADVQSAVSSFVQLRCYQKMIIYFSGHGVLKGPEHEIWLLSNANKTNSAVNLTGSILLSRNVGIEHLIFISDACRSVPNNIALMQVSGGEIFESNPPTRLRPVIDIFYATLPGDPAYEVPETTAVQKYKSLFTDNLLAGLNGSVAEVIKEHDNQACVPSWEMRRYLDVQVPEQIAQVAPDLVQIPDIRVESHFPPSYLSIINISNSGVPDLDPKKDAARPDPNVPKPKSSDPRGFGLSKVIRSMMGKIARTKVDPSANPYYYGIPRELVGFYKKSIFNLYDFWDVGPGITWEDVAPSAADDDNNYGRVNGKGPVFIMLQRTYSRDPILMGYVETVWDGLLLSTEYMRASPPKGDYDDTFFFITNYTSKYDIIVQPSAVISRFKNGFSLSGSDYVLIIFSFGAILLPRINLFNCEIIVRENGIYSINYFPSKFNPDYRWYRKQLEPISYFRSLMLTNSWSGIGSPFSGLAERLIYREEYGLVSSTIAILNAYNKLKRSNITSIENFGKLYSFGPYSHFNHIFDFALTFNGVNFSNDILQCPIFNQGWAVINAQSVRIPEPIMEASKYMVPGLFTVFTGKGIDILRAYFRRRV